MPPSYLPQSHENESGEQERRSRAPPTPTSTPPARRERQGQPVQQPPHTLDELDFAKRTLQKLAQHSTFFPSHESHHVHTVKESELDFGQIIGKGGFCEVRLTALRSNRNRYAMKYLSPSKTTSTRLFQRGLADLAMEACFLSLLRHENIIGLHYVATGSLEENYNIGDGSRERQLIQQDEVVMDANGNLQLRSSASSRTEHNFGYFLLLDPLYENLSDRIDNTYIPQIVYANAHQAQDNESMRNRIQTKALAEHQSEQSQLAERLDALTDVASAHKYLHANNIIFRDVKPDNIGFYRKNRGNGFEEITKVFDFGLCKEVKARYRKSHPAYPSEVTYKLTGCTGSRRYMAPEVCFSDPYNSKSDVFSFGMLLYQVASFVLPFDGFSMGKHEREVLRGGLRPDVTLANINQGLFKQRRASMSAVPEDPLHEMIHLMETNQPLDNMDMEVKNELLASLTKRSWTKELVKLMEDCWDYDMRYRPTMEEVRTRLVDIVSGLEHVRSRSGERLERPRPDSTKVSPMRNAPSEGAKKMANVAGSPNRDAIWNAQLQRDQSKLTEEYEAQQSIFHGAQQSLMNQVKKKTSRSRRRSSEPVISGAHTSRMR